jgi:hypothetical protein
MRRVAEQYLGTTPNAPIAEIVALLERAAELNDRDNRPGVDAPLGLANRPGSRVGGSVS